MFFDSLAETTFLARSIKLSPLKLEAFYVGFGDPK
jgi:hypothetical protein